MFGFIVLSTGIFTSERSKETIFVGIEETKSTLEPSGFLVAYKADRGGIDTICKLLFIVSTVVSGSPIDLPPTRLMIQALILIFPLALNTTRLFFTAIATSL